MTANQSKPEFSSTFSGQQSRQVDWGKGRDVEREVVESEEDAPTEQQEEELISIWYSVRLTPLRGSSIDMMIYGMTKREWPPFDVIPRLRPFHSWPPQKALFYNYYTSIIWEKIYYLRPHSDFEEE